jgi:nucleotide-binding universal stress UspA family protein
LVGVARRHMVLYMTTQTLDRPHELRRCGEPPACRPIVVVGHDGSRAGAAVVAHAAQRAAAGGYLIVVHALPLGVSPADLDGQHTYTGAVASLLDSVEAALPEGACHETRVVAGPASKALLEVAQRHDAHEIVLGASAGRAARGAIGRVSDAVLRRADRPVTIVPSSPSRPRSTGLAVDGRP